MKVTAKFKMDLDPESSGDLVSQILRKEYSHLAKEVESQIKKKGKLKDFHLLDIENNVKTILAMEEVLQYFMMTWEYDAWHKKHGFKGEK